MSKIQDNIKELRKKAGLTQEELAKKVGYTDRSSIAKIESGLIDPPQSKIKQLADVLGVLPSTLLGWDQEPEDQAAFEADILTDPELMGMVREYMTLSEEKKKAVRQMIHALSSD